MMDQSELIAETISLVDYFNRRDERMKGDGERDRTVGLLRLPKNNKTSCSHDSGAKSATKATDIDEVV